MEYFSGYTNAYEKLVSKKVTEVVQYKFNENCCGFSIRNCVNKYLTGSC